MRAIELLSYVSCSVVIAACGGNVQVDPIGTSAVEGPLSLSPAATCDDAGTEPDASQSSYAACATDSDCVALNLVERCCYNGWKIAVAKDEVTAYEEANACQLPPRQVICPMYIERDTRVPACDTATHECEMVPTPDAGNTEPGDPVRF
jgi:hypothetical protein